MSLGSKLKDLRTRKGQSLQQVANGVEVSKAYIWELEGGKSSNPGLGLLKKLADHFQVSVEFLADDAAPTEDAASLQFFREFNGKLQDEDWDILRSMADRLKDKDEK